MKNVRKSKSLKGWTLASSIAVGLAGQSVILPAEHAAAAVYNLRLLSVNEAKQVTFPDAKSFSELRLDLSDDLLKKISKRAGVSKMSKDEGTRAWQALDANGTVIGYFLMDKVYGKHELITYSVGIDSNGTVRHVEILGYNETYGSEINNKNWRDQFIGKNASSKLVLNKDIKNISGATLSCKHVTNGVKRMLALYEISLRNEA